MTLDINTSKTIGGIGALLIFISLFISFLVSDALFFLIPIGAILILVGLYGLSGHYRESGIFKNALIGTVVGIVGVVIAVVIAIALLWPSLITMFELMYPGWDGNINALPNAVPDPAILESSALLDLVFSMATNLIIILAVLCVFTIIAMFFIRQSLKQLREKSDARLFETTGTLMLVGGFLTIIVVGYILIWIAALLLAIAFFQLKPQEPPTTQYDTYQPPTPPPQQ